MKKVLYFCIAFFLGGAVMAAYLSFLGAPGFLKVKSMETKVQKGKSQGKKEERKPLFYRNPMNPAITSPVPAKDEMGMDYIPVYPEDLEGGSGKPSGTVVIDPVTMQKMGVRTVRAQRMRLSREITTYGKVTPDEDTLFMVHARFKGWVESMAVKRTGDYIKKGEVLCEVYSPEILTAQEEYLIALRSFNVAKGGDASLRRSAKGLLDASRKRLELFGLPRWYINRLKKDMTPRRQVPIESPARGVVLEVGVRPDAFITPQTTLYRIADLSRVWVMARLYAEDLSWVKKGDEALVIADELMDGPRKGEIDYIYPLVDQKERTTDARIELENPAFELRPGMFVYVNVKAKASRPVIAIPREAVLMTGKEEHVFVETGPGRFEPRAVTTGIRARGLVEIKKGVLEGEEVVVSGQFLIDSESSMKEAARKMLEPKGMKGEAATEKNTTRVMDMERGKGESR